MIIIFSKYTIGNRHQVAFCSYHIAPVGFNNAIRDLKNCNVTLLHRWILRHGRSA